MALGPSSEEGGGDKDSSDSSPRVTFANAQARTAVVAMASRTSHTNDWTVDLACSRTMTPNINSVMKLVNNCTSINLAEDSVIQSSHQGKVSLPVADLAGVDSLVVPDLHEPLLSVANVYDEGLAVVFRSSGCHIYRESALNLQDSAVSDGYRHGNLYYLPKEVSPTSVSLTSLPVSDTSLLGYHRRLNNIGLKPLKKLLKAHNIPPTVLNEIEVQQCDVFVQGKMHRHPFKTCPNYRATSVGAQIHSNGCTYEVASREGFKYLITFVDDFSMGLWVFPMKLKSDSFHFFKKLRTFFKKDKCHTVLQLTTNNGGEYMSNKFEAYLLENGISHVPRLPHSPKLNGVAERTNRTISNHL